jgi:hypothetical protein
VMQKPRCTWHEGGGTSAAGSRGGGALASVLTVININYKPSAYPAYILNSITKYRSRGLN